MNVCCHIEIDYDLVRARREGRTVEVPLRRAGDGTLTAECKATLTAELSHLLPTGFLGTRHYVLCAVPSRGLSLRRLTIPKGAPDQRRRLLTLQIESEFPVAPRDLAWGSAALNGHSSLNAGPSSNGATEEVLVAAIKKDTLRDFTEVLRACGVSPIFTPAALARAALCPPSSGKTALLEVGRTHTELMVLSDGVPASLKILNWGIKDGMVHDQGDGEAEFEQALQELIPMLGTDAGTGFQKLWIGGIAKNQIASHLSRVLVRPCAPVATSDPQASTALAGMLWAAETNTPLLELATEVAVEGEDARKVSPGLKRWAIAAAILILGALLVPHMEAWIMKPGLEKTLAAVKPESGRLKQIDDELAFLRNLKQSQPSYIDALYLISRSAPPGTRFDALSLNRQGVISLKASLRDGNQVAEFRAKLLDTGLFSNLALEEQTPSPDRQKLSFRMSGQWKPTAAGELATAAAGKEPDPAPRPTSGPGGFPAGMPMPMGMPPGVTMPMPAGAPMAMPTPMPPGVSVSGPIRTPIAAGPPNGPGMPVQPGGPAVPGSVPTPVPSSGAPVPSGTSNPHP